VREPNILLDALIDEAGMSHDGFAARVNQAGERCGLLLLYDHASVRRWIRDGTIPRGQVPEILCEVLSNQLGRTVTLPDAGLDGGPGGDGTLLTQAVDAATAMWRTDCKQPGALRAARRLQGPAAIAPVYEWENPPEDLDVARHAGRRVSRDQVRMLQAARLRYERMYREAGGIPVRPRVTQFLALHAAPLVRGAYDDPTGRELYRAAGGLVALAGICAYDTDLHGLAQRYYFQALRMAKASGDRGFGGYVVALLANQALFQGQNRLVIQYAETALRATLGNLSPALVSDLYALQAKAYARIGDRAGCHAAMTRAEDAAARIRPDQEPPETSYVQAGLVETQHADALRALGDLAAARGYAQQSVDESARSHARGRVHRLATLAVIQAGQGEAEDAVGTAMRMLDQAAGMESRRIEQRITCVRDAVTAVSDGRAAGELAERVADMTTAPLRTR
jgi:tetratricopeptide (TPR) repeat protein